MRVTRVLGNMIVNSTWPEMNTYFPSGFRYNGRKGWTLYSFEQLTLFHEPWVNGWRQPKMAACKYYSISDLVCSTWMEKPFLCSLPRASCHPKLSHEPQGKMYLPLCFPWKMQKAAFMQDERVNCMLPSHSKQRGIYVHTKTEGWERMLVSNGPCRHMPPSLWRKRKNCCSIFKW